MRITSASLTLAMTTIVCARVTEIDVSKIQARQSALGPHYINAIWTNRDIESADLGGGNQIVHGSGFALVDDAGNTIWSNAYPAGYAPCELRGSKFKLQHGCLGSKVFEFDCTSTFSGNPDTCTVKDAGGNILASADGDSSQTFTGISISQDGYCGLSFPLGENTVCTAPSDDIEACCHSEGMA